jgi:protein SCO1/2
LPVYGDKVLSGKMNRNMGREIPDTVFHQIRGISLVNDKGDSVSFLGQDTAISVVHLFYAKDSTLSVAMARNMRPVVERFRTNDKVRFYSLSVDPSDSPKELAAFASHFSSGLQRNWDFVANADLDLLTYSRDQLLIDAMRDPVDNSRFVISNNYVLIDSKGRIRGFYDINLKSNLDKLEDEIKVQLVEEIRDNPIKIEKR